MVGMPHQPSAAGQARPVDGYRQIVRLYIMGIAATQRQDHREILIHCRLRVQHRYPARQEEEKYRYVKKLFHCT
jgi:hypothetical protein